MAIKIRQEDEYIYLTLPNGSTMTIKEEAEGIVLDVWEDINNDSDVVYTTYWFWNELGKDIEEK